MDIRITHISLNNKTVIIRDTKYIRSLNGKNKIRQLKFQNNLW
jgi:hypothetical protein